MKKLSELNDNDVVVVIANIGEDEVESVKQIRTDKNLYVGKEMQEVVKYIPNMDAQYVIDWIEEDTKCNDEMVSEDWELECCEEYKEELQKLLNKIMNSSQSSWTYGEKIENDLLAGDDNENTRK